MPDIHWHVGEDKDQETIAHASSPRRSRRSWVAILIVVILGVGLGMAYRSLPEAAPRPTPTLSPTPAAVATRAAIPAALYQTLDREAQALADGDVETILAAHVPEDQAWIDWKRTTIEPWGHPANNGLLYTIIAFNLPSSTRAWADIRQFRNGRFFRETRFYLWNKDRWLQTWLPDRSFWTGEEETLHTLHFTVTYAAEDRELIPIVANQLEADYASLCRDQGCASAGHEMTFTVKMDVYAGDFYFTIGERIDLMFPSPRFMGLFESGRAYDESNSSGAWALAHLMVRRVVYGEADLERPGQLILDAGATWALEHIDSLSENIQSIIGNLNQRSLLSLDKLWEHPDDSKFEQTYSQAYMLMHFIEQEYGAAAVTRLLGAVGSAKSMSDAVENGLGIPFAEFDQKWQAWANQNILSQ